jgi:hypothetical protein
MLFTALPLQTVKEKETKKLIKIQTNIFGQALGQEKETNT